MEGATPTNHIFNVEDLDKAKQYMKAYGYVVIKGIYDDRGIQALKQSVVDTVIKPLEPKFTSLDDFEFRKFLPGSFKGMYQTVGHSQAQWDVRQNPKIVNIFRQLYDLDPLDFQTKIEDCDDDGVDPEMKVSFDAICIREGKAARSFQPKADWYHLDQTSGSELKCIQGFVSLFDMPKDGSPLRVLPKSHDNHAHIMEANSVPLSQKNWYKFSDDQMRTNMQICGSQRTLVTCGAGDLVLWDSRTIHMGGHGPAEIPRLVIYVSYQPTSFLGSDEKKGGPGKSIEKRQRAFKERLCTSHWACSVINIFPKRPRWARADSLTPRVQRFYDDKTTVFKSVKMTNLGKALL